MSTVSGLDQLSAFSAIALPGRAGVITSLRFLDCRTFATCSDDTTVVLWDVRLVVMDSSDIP